MKRITLITGGARSGKSSHALELMKQYERKAFIATAIPFDEEMKERIEKHKSERDPSFITIEEPRDLAGALKSISPDIQAALIDCLTVWLGNILEENKDDYPEIEPFIKALNNAPCDLVIVTNEVGMGIVPDNALARKFRDLAGVINQRVAAMATEVFLMISGIPSKLK